jgi:hypothetical protein
MIWAVWMTSGTPGTTNNLIADYGPNIVWEDPPKHRDIC